MNAENKKPTDAPAMSEQDWDEVGTDEVTPTSTPQNADLRYDKRHESAELPEEDDDNPYQESDEALPNDREERAITRDPGKESGLFDEV
jgi:hypothetical protein